MDIPHTSSENVLKRYFFDSSGAELLMGHSLARKSATPEMLESNTQMEKMVPV